MSNRLNNRKNDQLRDVVFTRKYTEYAEGSVLVEFGKTQVICTASIDDKVPSFLKGQNKGWLTAEYSMLPRSTHTRNLRDGVLGKVNSRSSEISRLIGRSLRACLDLSLLSGIQITIDCDVIQADGGTRTASITGAFIALYDAMNLLLDSGRIKHFPIKQFVAAISVGVCGGNTLLDLDYSEDSSCDMDMNVVMFEDLNIIEIQGAAEGSAISRTHLNSLLDIAQAGIGELIKKQRKALCLLDC